MTSHNDSMLGRVPLGVTILIVFMCTCILQQVLGTPVGLIDLLDSEATVESSLSEGLTIPPENIEVSRANPVSFFHISDSPQYQLSLGDSFFHPPLLS
jgi:hypothetical protein